MGYNRFRSRRLDVRHRFTGTLFSPSALFENGEEGFWYEFGDINTLYKDDAGTVPVTDDGDTVGRVLDKSGNGHHLTQSTALDRPTYTLDGNGIPCLEFDGANTILTNGSLDLTSLTKALVSIGLQTTSNAKAGIAFGHNTSFSTAGGLECLSPTGANTTNLLGSRSTSGATNYVGLVVNNASPYKFVVTSQIDYDQSAGDEVVGIWQGEDMAQNGGPTQENTGTFGNGVLAVGGRASTLGVIYTGYIYSLIFVAGTHTDPERQSLNTYVNGKTIAY